MAVITVSPTTDISALIASDNVSPGDVLVLEDGEYFQTVNVTKNNLRIVAKGTKAVFDGKSVLLTGFILNGVTGVEVNGISITNYRGSGISITGGSGHRIVGNKINGVQSNGIWVVSTRECLLWKNEICNTFDGVQLFFTSVNNRIIDNLATLCTDDGFESFSQNDSHNVFAGNVAINNGGYGLHNFGNNNLLVDNILVGNKLGGMNLGEGSNVVAVGNTVKNNGLMGCFIFDNTNLFFGKNKVEGNLSQSLGIVGRANNGIYQENKVKHNTDRGIITFALTQSNFIFNNKLKCNLPVNIEDVGTNNTYFNNIEEPCRPHELQFEDCESCLKAFEESIAEEQKKKRHGILADHKGK